MRYIQITAWFLLLISCTAAVAQDSPFIPEDYVITFRDEFDEPIFTVPLYWMISPEITSQWTGEPADWNGDPTTSTRWPMKAELDYVRIYKRQQTQDSSR